MFKGIFVIFGIIAGILAAACENNCPEYQTPQGFDQKKSGVTYGTITKFEYHSGTTGSNRAAYVYLPPNYDKGTTYPVMYLLHGICCGESDWVDSGNPNEILSNLIASGEVPPLIAIIPNIRAAKDGVDISDIFGSANVAACNNFINDLRDDLAPYVKKQYPIADGRDKTAIGGLSMGGMESLYIGLKMPESYGYLGAFEPAPGLPLSNNEMNLPSTYKNNTFIMIVQGNSDSVVGTNPGEYHKSLEGNGVPHIFYTMDGDHEWSVWKNALYNFARRIF